MSKKSESGDDLFSELGHWMTRALECNQTLVEGALEKLSKPHKQIDTALTALSSFAESALNSDPACVEKLIDHQLELITNQLTLMEATFERVLGNEADPVIRPSVNDRRFIDEEWTKNPFFDFIKQSYLLNHQALTNMVDSLNLPGRDREKVDFYTRQVSSALAPTNFPLSNPEIVRRIHESRGESLIQGVEKLVEDQRKSGDFLSICMSDTRSFSVGENLVTTPGKVVFENELMQLIQYSPTQEETFEIPLLFTPSWVNKFYIYDLREKNSMVKWALDQGFTVFMISWVNPDASYRHMGFDDYLQKGLLTAVEKIKQISGSSTVNSVGYCLGGALLAAGAAYLARQGDKSINSATYLATSFDYTDLGDMRVMMDDLVVKGVNETIDQTGYLDGRSLGVTFSMLRENELYWNYYIQNYLKGERPSGFDILHWNGDSTNVPARMHRFVLNDLVRGNAFMRFDGFDMLGERLNIRETRIPVYILATEKDHIAKWQSCYPGAGLHGGHARFVLAGSGHIAGVINSPLKTKYHYYTNTKVGADPDKWLDGAFMHEGSWWPDWCGWLSELSGEQRTSLSIDSSRVIEDAPGRYVKRRLDDMDLTETPGDKAA